MKVSINEERCIGCGVCIQIDPDVFSLASSRGVAKVIRPEGNSLVSQAMTSCPVDAIIVEE
ncbi:ferredoxin [Jonquetella anthropi DSM 22815]|uniref:Ferredoxin n=1 Tax=Jonquetella anthropi DSM 22815 TaxID=885272 RepID=H0UJL1_9BACT|nr:ferredoxin [Jonquetella anthropi]EEX48862.1 putative ferredoxin [Jonquetella anthropi E3_33 E1]EHM12879.1 ferredoxin [Jonquetella anthropi DSM 22815]